LLPQTSIAGFKGSTSKGKRVRERKKEEQKDGKRKKGELGMENGIAHPLFSA